MLGSIDVGSNNYTITFCHLWGEGAIRKICVKGIIFIVRRCGYLVGRGCSDGDRGGGDMCATYERYGLLDMRGRGLCSSRSEKLSRVCLWECR